MPRLAHTRVILPTLTCMLAAISVFAHTGFVGKTDDVDLKKRLESFLSTKVALHTLKDWREAVAKVTREEVNDLDTVNFILTGPFYEDNIYQPGVAREYVARYKQISEETLLEWCSALKKASETAAISRRAGRHRPSFPKTASEWCLRCFEGQGFEQGHIDGTVRGSATQGMSKGHTTESAISKRSADRQDGPENRKIDILVMLCEQNRLFKDKVLDKDESRRLLARLRTVPKDAVVKLAEASNSYKESAALALITSDSLFVRDTFQECAFQKLLKHLAKKEKNH